MKKILSLLFILSTTLLLKAQNPNPKIWTKSEEKIVYDSFYSVANSLFASNEQKSDYAKYCLKHIEEKFPNGVDNASDDSIKNAMYLIGQAYTRQAKTFQLQSWTPQYENLIKSYLVENPNISNLSEQQKSSFCDCYIINLKRIYPNGVSQHVPKATQDSISKSCLKKINSN